MSHLAPVGHNNPPSEVEIVIGRLEAKDLAVAKQLDFVKRQPAPNVIEDERMAGIVTESIKIITGIKKSVTDIHKEVKAPYLECGKAVDAWKNRNELMLDAVRATYAKPLEAYLAKRAAEERARQLEISKQERERAEALAAEAQETAQAGIADTAEELLDAACATEQLAGRIEDNAHTAKLSSLAKARSTSGASASQRLVWTGDITNLQALDLNKLRRNFTEVAIQTAVNQFVREGGRELDGVKIWEKPVLSVR